MLRSALAVGAAAMAFYLSARPIRSHAGLKMFVCVAAVLHRNDRLRPLADVLALAGGAGGAGAADMMSVFVRQTLVQLVTPDAMRGRVAAVSTLFISASNELGEFRGGLVARFLGSGGRGGLRRRSAR